MAAVAALRNETTSDRLIADNRRRFQLSHTDRKTRFASKGAELGVRSARFLRPEASLPAGRALFPM